MTTFVALLRGVNVGKAKRVPMAQLRELLSGLGYTGVATLLNSGNAVFAAARGAAKGHASRIAQAIEAQLHVTVPVIVKTARDLDAAVADNPFRVDVAHHSRFLVAFAQDAAALRGLAAIDGLVGSKERFAIGRHAAYLYCANGILESRAGEALLGKIGRAATTRNLATTLKLQLLARNT